MIIPKNSFLCGLCENNQNCSCECHLKNIMSGLHYSVYSLPMNFKIKNEGKAPERADFILMRLNKMPKSLRFKIREPFKKLLR